MPLILRADSLTIIKWWVEASYAAHLDIIGHTGVTMTFGRWYVRGITKKLKIKAKSSAEAEFIGNDDALPQILWAWYFIADQGFTIDESVVFRDNLSAMLLKSNGMAFSSKWANHIRVRYCFIKNRISVGNIVVKNWPNSKCWQIISPSQRGTFTKYHGRNTRSYHFNDW